MRIALIAPQPFVEARGTPMANFRIAQILADCGYEVDVITCPFGEDPEHPGVHTRRCRGIPFVRSVGIGFSMAKLLLDISVAATAAVLVRRSRYDCIHGVEEGAFIALVLSCLTGLPLVYDADSVLSHEVAGSALGRLPGFVWLTSRLERLTARRAALIVTISESMAAHARSIAPGKDVIVVPDVPIPMPESGVDGGRARVQMPPQFASRKLIVYTGSMARYQGLDLLIPAMKRVSAVVPDTGLVIVGGGEEQIRWLMEAAQDMGVMSYLLFMGKKPPGEIPDFLDAGDVLVSPRRGGINPPAKIYTYMQSGKPIVATDIPAHSSVLGEDGAFLVDVRPDSIADGIIRAISDPEEASRRAGLARRRVSEITPELQEKRVRDGYARLCARIEGRAAQDEVAEPE